MGASWLAALGLAVVLMAMPQNVLAETRVLTLPQARLLARDALRAGRPALANALARRLLQANPADTQALLIIAATEPRLGRPAEGRAAGKRAFRSAKTPGLRFESALFTANAAEAEKKYTAAQIWLRRAHQAANQPGQKKLATRRFQAVRAKSPWRANLAFRLQPSRNLNGGSSASFLVVDDVVYAATLSGSARALAGARLSFEGSLAYALSRGPNHRTQVELGFYRSFNRLTADARDQAPDLSGSDLDYGLLELRLSHKMRTGASPLPDDYLLAIGQSWYGGEALEQRVRLGLGKTYALSKKSQLRLGAQWEHRTSNRARADRTTRGVSLQFGQKLASGDRVTLALGATRLDTDEANHRYSGQRLTIAYSKAKPVASLRLSASVSYVENHYPDYRLGIVATRDGRRDKRLSAAVNVEFDDITFYGFKPVLTLHGERGQSNISRFETKDLGLSLGFRTAF